MKHGIIGDQVNVLMGALNPFFPMRSSQVKLNPCSGLYNLMLNGSLRLRWMGPTLHIPCGFRVQGASKQRFPKAHYPQHVLSLWATPKISVGNQFWVRCCGRVAQSGQHSASEKTGIQSVWETNNVKPQGLSLSMVSRC